MKCPYCAHLGDKVVDSRESKEGDVIRRRRECLDCGRRFTSYERIDEIPYMVIKKDGSRERFERQKLLPAPEGRGKASGQHAASVSRRQDRGDSGPSGRRWAPEVRAISDGELKRLDKVTTCFASSIARSATWANSPSEIKDLLSAKD
jgi:transcriptional repressor NrdR